MHPFCPCMHMPPAAIASKLSPAQACIRYAFISVIYEPARPQTAWLSVTGSERMPPIRALRPDSHFVSFEYSVSVSQRFHTSNNGTLWDCCSSILSCYAMHNESCNMHPYCIPMAVIKVWLTRGLGAQALFQTLTFNFGRKTHYPPKTCRQEMERKGREVSRYHLTRSV